MEKLRKTEIKNNSLIFKPNRVGKGPLLSFFLD